MDGSILWKAVWAAAAVLTAFVLTLLFYPERIENALEGYVSRPAPGAIGDPHTYGTHPGADPSGIDGYDDEKIAVAIVIFLDHAHVRAFQYGTGPGEMEDWVERVRDAHDQPAGGVIFKPEVDVQMVSDER